MRKENQRKAIFCCICLGMLCLVWFVDALTKDKLYSSWEKRMLAQKPQLEFSAVLDGSYEKDYEQWLTDQFPSRDLWVNIKTRCEILLGKKEISGIYLGEDGFLFTAGTETTNWDVLEKQLQSHFGEAVVSRIHAPNAGAVYAEKLPSPIEFSAVKDEIFKNLENHKEEYIYFRTDHHWTMLGAYYAYEAWAKQQGMVPLALESLEKQLLKEDFLGTHYGKIHYAKQPDSMELYEVGVESTAVYDAGTAKVSGLYHPEHLETDDAYRFFLNGNHGLVEITTQQKGGSIAVLKDSFANNLIPFLTAHYEKIIVIDPRYFRTDIVKWLEEQQVEQFLIIAQDTTEIVKK